ncbi:hypothetical protein J2793_006915 [Paraburkholderia caledonica]|uniref:Uncharacterized protein n=1 Tax=Paraburkholderia caledonica TaxID=134536 RepID=A0AB73IND4_9BURK|nr:hypothetical protein [Paraburkholderia caledonica]
MKTLKDEEINLAGYVTFADVTSRLPSFLRMSTKGDACIRR